MINYYDKNRFISKRELARLADVSPRTFSRYLATRRHILDAMGISPKAQKLPPHAVKYICEDYCIDLPTSKTKRRSTPLPSRTSSSPPGKKRALLLERANRVALIHSGVRKGLL